MPEPSSPCWSLRPWVAAYVAEHDDGILHRIHELAKAGALIAAEIDRLQRASYTTNGNEDG